MDTVTGFFNLGGGYLDHFKKGDSKIKAAFSHFPSHQVTGASAIYSKPIDQSIQKIQGFTSKLILSRFKTHIGQEEMIEQYASMTSETKKSPRLIFQINTCNHKSTFSSLICQT